MEACEAFHGKPKQRLVNYILLGLVLIVLISSTLPLKTSSPTITDPRLILNRQIIQEIETARDELKLNVG
jgi:hypothetical protein